MGLQSQLNDVSSDSIPLLLVAIIAAFVGHVRSSMVAFLHSLGICRLDLTTPPPESYLSAAADDQYDGLIGSGLGSLVVLADQLNLNRLFSYRYDHKDAVSSAADCVVCLNGLRDGDQVRMLQCRHVFHKHCFDGWLDHLNFTCPLCRSPLVRNERVELTRRRVGGDLIHWFSLRAN